MAKIELNEFYYRFGTNYVNLISSSVYSVEVLPVFIVNLCKGQISVDSLELAVGVAVISSLRGY